MVGGADPFLDYITFTVGMLTFEELGATGNKVGDPIQPPHLAPGLVWVGVIYAEAVLCS